MEEDFALVGSVRKIPWYVGKHWRMPVGLRWLLPRLRQSVLWCLRRMGIRLSQRVAQRSTYDCVLCNSIASIWCLQDIVPKGTPVVLWAHELEYAITCLSLPPALLRSALQSVDRFIACGKAVRDNLVENYGVPSTMVETTTEFIEEISPPTQSNSSRSTLLPGVPVDALIVSVVAWVQHRKGPDLFLRMARHLPREIDGHPVHFVWVGAEASPGMIDELMHRARLAGINDRMHFLGERKHPTAIVAMSDVFVLPSREDPYPLVMIEAGMVSRPIVAFRGTGGAEEFLGDGVGILVPYGDVVAMAKATLELLRDRAFALSLGEKAHAKALLHTVERVAPTIEEACMKVMSER